MARPSHRASPAIRIAVVPYVLAFASCVNSASPGDSPSNLGSIGIDLDVTPDIHLDAVAYDVSGNGFHQAGNIDISHSTRLTALIGGIPAGLGYTILLTAADRQDPRIVCSGSAMFDVVAEVVTDASVRMQCRISSQFGSVLVTGVVNVCPTIDELSVLPAETTVGHSVALEGAASDQDGVPGPLTYVWASSGGILSQSGGPDATFTCTSAGQFTVTLTAADGDCAASAAAHVDCTQAADGGAPNVKINEVESNGGVPGDWVELYNAGSASGDISGWVFKDNDDTHVYVIPTGTTIAPGAYFMLEEATFGFGLGSADSARLFDATGVTVVDSFSWTAHATTTYGRCPNGTGNFTTTVTVTKGAANDCPAGDAGGTGSDAGSDGGSLVFSPWPGSDAVATVDGANVFGTNMSGLAYQPALGGGAAVLWAVQNSPSRLYRLVFDGTIWSSTTTDDWGSGKNLHYPDGTGTPDSEGITQPDVAAPAIYASTERNGDADTISRLSVLRFDTSAAGAELTATHEWNLTADLPVVGPNLGLEAVAFVPDAYLVGKALLDESTGQAYQPDAYPDHAGGLFLVGVEANGIIYAYALDHTAGGFHRVATIASGQAAIMDLAFDRDNGALWAWCDNTCGNRATVLDVDTDPTSTTFGRFKIKRAFERPSGMPNINNEGITFAPESECAGGVKAFFWSDDDQTDGHVIRQGAVQCGSL